MQTVKRNGILYAAKLLLLLLFCFPAGAQGVYLVKGKKRIPFPTIYGAPANIGVYTDKDTLEYTERRFEGWEVVWSTVDSFEVRRKVRSVDSVVLRRTERTPEGYLYNKDFKKDGVKYTLLTKVLEYEYRQFAFKDVRKIKYVAYTGNGSGCMGCILIPVFNVGFFIWAKKRWDAKELEVGKYARVPREE